MIHRYGWRPDKPDHRDRYRLRRYGVALPPLVDLSPQCPPVYDQGSLGACTGNALAGGVQYLRMKLGLPNFVPSRLFIYFNERTIEGTVASDAGAEIKDGITTLMTQGACSEDDWPYDVSKFADQPPANCYTDAKTDLITKALRVDQTIDDMRDCLAAGLPFAFGFTAYPELESGQVAADGILPMPNGDEQPIGGHAVLAVGYEDDRQAFKVRNSWGAAWGQGGYFWMPYAYLIDENLASDFWQIDAVTTESGSPHIATSSSEIAAH